MQFRFRFLDAEGREVEVATIDDLRDRLHSGDVAPDTLLYDVLTGEWAPLRAHAVGRLLEDVGETPAEPAATAGEEAFDFPGLSLDPAVSDASATSSEDAVRELMKEREREGPTARPDLAGFRGGAWSGGLVDPDMATPSTPAGRDASAPPEAPRPGGASSGAAAAPPPSAPRAGSAPASADVGAKASRAASPPSSGPPATPSPVAPDLSPGPSGERPLAGLASVKRLGEAGDEAPPTVVVPPADVPRPSRRAASGAPPKRRPSGSSVRLVALGAAGFLALLVYAVGWSDDDPSPPADVVTAEVPRRPRPAGEARARTATLLGSEAVALADMGEALDSLRREQGIGDVPLEWLEGIYLANASQYPEVRAYWERYARFVTDVRQRDTLLFRQSFVRRLDEEGVTGPMVPMRLARALRVFEESQPARDTVYRAMDELAQTALELHGLLVEREADIEYDPVLPNRVSRDPVVEAVMEDERLRAEMWALLDRVFRSLSVLSGGDPRTREAVGGGSFESPRTTRF